MLFKKTSDFILKKQYTDMIKPYSTVIQWIINPFCQWTDWVCEADFARLDIWCLEVGFALPCCSYINHTLPNHMKYLIFVSFYFLFYLHDSWLTCWVHKKQIGNLCTACDTKWINEILKCNSYKCWLHQTRNVQAYLVVLFNYIYGLFNGAISSYVTSNGRMI
jgi:hypothetical protein